MVEIDFDTINSIGGVFLVFLLNLFKQVINVNTPIKVNFLFRDMIVGISGFENRNIFTRPCQMRQEECYAHQRIAAIMQIGINNTAVTFAHL